MSSQGWEAAGPSLPRSIEVSGSFPLGAKMTFSGADYVHTGGGRFELEEWRAVHAFVLPMRTENAANAGFGMTKAGARWRARKRKDARGRLKVVVRGSVARMAGRATFKDAFVDHKIRVTITRIAPRKLDEHDGLRTALKSVVDGIADGLGFKRDDDPRLVWQYKQERGRVREYAVGVVIEIQKIERASIEGV